MNYKIFITEISNIKKSQGGNSCGSAVFKIENYENFHAIDVETSVVNIDQKLLKDETVMQSIKITLDKKKTIRLKEYLNGKGSLDEVENKFSFDRDLFTMIIWTGDQFVVYGTRYGLKPFHGKSWSCYFCGIEDCWSDIYIKDDKYTFNNLVKLLELHKIDVKQKKD